MGSSLTGRGIFCTLWPKPFLTLKKKKKKKDKDKDSFVVHQTQPWTNSNFAGRNSSLHSYVCVPVLHTPSRAISFYGTQSNSFTLFLEVNSVSSQILSALKLASKSLIHTLQLQISPAFFAIPFQFCLLIFLAFCDSD